WNCLVNSWKVILATMVIFGAGVITGGLLVEHSGPIKPVRPPKTGGVVIKPFQPVSPNGFRLEFLRRAQRELNLTGEQRERVERIMSESQERTRKLMEPVAPELREEFQRTKEHFRAVLTPEQRVRFDELWKQQQQRSREPRHQPTARETSSPPASLRQ